MKLHSIRHCPACGAPVRYRVPDDGDVRERAVCTACGAVHYENPLLVLGTVPYLGERVLLCQRAIEPRRGKWTLPAGFMELGESMAEGAARETAEESGARIRMGPLFSWASLPRVSQVHVFYLAEMLDATLAPGSETLQARLFAESEIPWPELAFATVTETLRRFFADRQRGAFAVHEIAIPQSVHPPGT